MRGKWTPNKLRHYIYMLGVLEAVLFGLSEYLIVFSSAVLSLRLPLFGGSIDIINSVALSLLAASVAYQSPSELLSGAEMAVVVTLVPIIYRLSSTVGASIKHALIGILIVWGLFYIKSRIFDRINVQKLHAKCAYAVTISCLLAVSTGLIISFKWGMEIAVMLVGIYFLSSKFTETVLYHEPWADPVEVIYKSIVSLSESPTGTIYAGIALTALYWTFYTGPDILVAPASIDGYLNLRSVPFLTTVTAAPFIFALAVYWIYLLRRLPYSAQYWHRGSFCYEVDSKAPERLRLWHFLLFMASWLLAVSPQFFARLAPGWRGIESNILIAILYLSCLLLAGIVTIILLLPRLRRKISDRPFGKYFQGVQTPSSIQYDHWVVLGSFFIVILSISFAALRIRNTPFDVIYVSLIGIIAWADIKKSPPWKYATYTAVIIIILPFLISSSSRYWEILIFVSIGYLFSKLSKYFVDKPTTEIHKSPPD